MNERIEEINQQVMDEVCPNPLHRFAELLRQDYANQFVTDAKRDENIRSEERRHLAGHYSAIVQAAVLAEREACAKVCDDIADRIMGDNVTGSDGAGYCVNEIRSRGDKTKTSKDICGND